MLPIAFQTLGCKLNQCETGSIAAAFANAGFPVVADAVKAGLLVVNTCAVTSKAEQKGRRMIRAALNRNPLCSVIVTGCGAGADMAGIEVSASGSSERRVFLIPGTQKSRVMDIPLILAREGAFDQASLRAALERFCGAADGGTDASSAFRFEAAPAGFRSRYFLKIQDGCDNSCAYCLVRVARGPAKSLSAEEALRRLRAAEADGAAEAVLTGVNIGQWNKACGGLPALLKSLLVGTNRIGLRLSSLEPDIFTEDFFAALENPRVRPHFHLSIQSGSLNILKRMGRHYGPEAALGAIGRLRSVKKDPFIACDIITGFPGETERDFRETLEFCEAADFARIHAFPFSRRRGTAAWDFKPSVPERVSRERVKILQNLASSCRKRYIELWIGRETGGICLSDDATAARTGTIEVLSDNCLRLGAAVSDNLTGSIRKGRRLRCRIGEIPSESVSVGGKASLIDARCMIIGE